ncbi:MAG: NAD(P)/FAD-dependent oxidoreductase [Nitrospira sp.]|nr:NAD(P)/FAD-dependent oxidoreductase [Nitrospira sp.]
MYDVVIIGAGMSGLVCGCYLAKAGMKVLIAEQHHKPGGYCTSFKRQGFTFDAAAHSFGAYREDGIVRKIFNDLEVDKRTKIQRVDPSDVIMAPDYKISFWADLDKTINDFQKAFSDESKNIKIFFSLFVNPEPIFFVRMRSWTFKDLLDKYFTNNKLKAMLSLPLYGNSGVPPAMLSACMGAQIFIEFLLDGGYYPEGGMKSLPDALTVKFRELGGELRLSCAVKKIEVKDGKVIGTVLEKDGFVLSRYVVSNCDARQTFFKLLGRKVVGHDFLSRMNNMIPSLSAFVLYLGVDKFYNLPEPGSNVWVLPQYDLNKAYSLVRKGKLNSIGGYLMHVYPDRKSLLSLIPVPFINRKYWNNNKEKLLESFIKRIEIDAVPGLSEHIIYKDAATPPTLHRYTLNYKGAAFGWAVTPSQLAIPDLRKPSFIQGLYLTGNWTTQGVGISGVIYVGYDTAKLILRKEKAC